MIGSGLGASIGFAKESTYGTVVTPVKFPEMETWPHERRPNFVQGGGLAAGRMLKPSSRYVLVSRDGGLTGTMEVPSKGFGFLLENLMGSSTIVQQGATAAWLQTHVLGDNKGKSLTIQSGVPDQGGTVRPYTLPGSKMVSMELSCGFDDPRLMANMTFDSQDYSEATALAAPSYSTGIVPRQFAEMGFKMGAVGAEAAVSGVKKVTLKIERKMNTSLQYANGGGKKAEPILNDWADVSGTFEVDYVTKADFADRVPLTGSVSVIWEFVGPLIASTFFQTFRVKMPATLIESGDPQVDGPDVVNATYNFVVDDDQTNVPVTIEYMSVDTTIL